MKRISLALSLVCIATASLALDIIAPGGAWLTDLPRRIVTETSVISPVSLDAALANGYRIPTDQDYADKAAAEAAAAEAAALYADIQPAVFAPRISGALSNVVGQSQLFVDDATDELFAVDETGSPEHTQAQKEAQAQAREARKVAKAQAAASAAGAKNWQELQAAVVAWMEAQGGNQ